MSYKKEQEMYPAVSGWLEIFLRDRHKHSTIKVFDTSRKRLNNLIIDLGLQNKMPPDCISWDIQVDIVGFAIQKNLTHLALVECKNDYITLRDLSQLIGYSLVALPIYSFIISPQGPSDSLILLLKTYNRLDVLRYHHPKGKLPLTVTIARWVEEANSIDLSTIISGDSSFIGGL